jgi:tripartite-type tricarboxylate transporter receptor subunit TctC
VGVVRTESPYKSLKNPIAAAKAKPNGVRIGGSSVGYSDNIIAMMLGSPEIFVTRPGSAVILAFALLAVL